MNKNQLLELIRVNLRYANPQITNRERSKGKNGKVLTKALINQHLLSGIIFLAIYGLTMVMMDFTKMPGLFTYYLALFSILAFSQGITAIYNVFFESQDLPAYLPLPFQQSAIFLAKILVVLLTVVPFVFPMLVVLLLTGWRSGTFLPITILLAFFLFFLLLTIIFSICCLIVFGLTKTSFFKKHKKTVTTLLLGISMIVTLIGILLMNNQETYIDAGQMDRKPIGIFLPIFKISTMPFAKEGLVNLFVLIILCLIFLYAVKQFIVPKLYDQLTDIASNKGAIRRNHKENQSLKQLILKYNTQLLKEPNLIMQVLSNSLLIPIIFIITFAVTGSLDLSQLGIRFIGVIFLSGVVIACMTVNQTSFISNLISLDQENFLFLQTLPISMQNYMKHKFMVGFFLQTMLTGALSLIAGFLFKLPFLLLLSLFIGACLGSYLLCLRYFSRDYRLLLLNWTSIDQLFSRGSGNMGLVLLLLLSMIVGAILLTLYSLAALYFPFWPLNLSALSIFVLTTTLWINHYNKNFWTLFE